MFLPSAQRPSRPRLPWHPVAKEDFLVIRFLLSFISKIDMALYSLSWVCSPRSFD